MSQITILLVTSLICFVTPDKVIDISQPYGWKSEITKCASAGEESSKYTFRIGDIYTYGLKYNEINGATTVMAIGHINLYTKSELVELEQLLLSDYHDGGSYKEFRKDYGITATLGWATKKAGVILAVKFISNGAIDFTTTVYAGSWWSVSCAETKSYIDRIKITTH